MDLVVIDSGHGGSDQGKVGINEVLEKDINLKISKQVEKELKNKGYQVVMTREKDQMLAGETSGNSKIQDMKARVDLINEKAPGLAVSIHQNSYPSSDVHGAQVFYPQGSEKSKQLADHIQSAFIKRLDPNNHREAKANAEYYLFRDNPYPIVIVECGFLSNQAEAEKLCDEEYQDRIAWLIHKGILRYLKQYLSILSYL